MKNAMKKITSLMLAVMLLVCALPMGALATEAETTAPTVAETTAATEPVVTEAPVTTAAPEAPAVTEAPAAPVVETAAPQAAGAINVVIKVDNTTNDVWSGTKNVSGATESIANLLSTWKGDWKDYYRFSFASNAAGVNYYSENDGIANGDTVYILVLSRIGEGPAGGVGGSTGNATTNKFPYNVYLNVYMDTQVGSPNKTINITSGIALDGVVSLDEVKALVMDYYNAKDNYGIAFDGLYLAEGTWVVNYVTDTQKYGSFVEVNEMRQERTVYINVMITNAYAKTYSSSTTYTADSSNPKTGDEIYGAMAVMALSGMALATMFVLNKRRFVK